MNVLSLLCVRLRRYPEPLLDRNETLREHSSSSRSTNIVPHKHVLSLHPVCRSRHGVKQRQLKRVYDSQNLVEISTSGAWILAYETYSLVQIYQYNQASVDDGLS